MQLRRAGGAAVYLSKIEFRERTVCGLRGDSWHDVRVEMKQVHLAEQGDVISTTTVVIANGVLFRMFLA